MTTDPHPSGLLLIDKPIGLTSFDIIRHLRRQTGLRKIGHTGTLDPLATGLMLMLVGSACKQAATFSGLNKTYVGQMTLGATSTTGDAEGELIVVSAIQPSLAAIEVALDSFRGHITQTPSQYSAIKIGGQEAYKLARRGLTVAMPSRKVTVHHLTLSGYSYPVVNFEATVSAGTYIRSLAEDIGASLGTGAYLSQLRRTAVGEYVIDQSTTLDSITQATVNNYLMKLS